MVKNAWSYIMENTIERFVALFPEKEEVMRKIWAQRERKTDNITKFIGKTPDGDSVWFTNNPQQMLLCGATIPSSYSPSSESFKYLPTLVLQPYIGMIYVIHKDKVQMYIPTDEGDILAPKYACRAFVMHDNGEILAKFPTYCDRDYDCCALDEWNTTDFVSITSATPPVEIHLDCMDQFKHPDGHVAVFGKYITPQEQLDMFKRKYKGVNNDSVLD